MDSISYELTRFVLPPLLFPQSLLEIHLINMGQSKPKFVFSQIWLFHIKLMPKWLKKPFLFSLDIIEISSQQRHQIHLINMGHGKIQNIFFEKIKVLYLIDGQLKSTYVFRIFKSWFLWQWQAYEIHLINMGHSKPKLVFSQIWLAHVKLSPKWLKKTFFWSWPYWKIFHNKGPKST